MYSSSHVSARLSNTVLSDGNIAQVISQSKEKKKKNAKKPQLAANEEEAKIVCRGFQRLIEIQTPKLIAGEIASGHYPVLIIHVQIYCRTPQTPLRFPFLRTRRSFSCSIFVRFFTVRSDFPIFSAIIFWVACGSSFRISSTAAALWAGNPGFQRMWQKRFLSSFFPSKSRFSKNRSRKIVVAEIP